MSELIDPHKNLGAIRWQLLTTVSILALLPPVFGTARADSEYVDHPVVWIELGGQLERQAGQDEPYAPPFALNYPNSPIYKVASPVHLDRPPLFSNGGDGKVTFAPEGSDWIFSASVRYGRANGNKSGIKSEARDQPSSVAPYYVYGQGFHCCRTGTPPLSRADFVRSVVTHRDSHLILDFQAGKDVGLGLFGHNSDSAVNFGIRFAQFTAKADVSLRALPDLAFYNGAPKFLLSKYPQVYFPAARYHSFAGAAHSVRSFRGMGPEISWNSSEALLGNAQAGEFAFDWGANIAVLFGRRKAQGQHHETGHYVRPKYSPPNLHYSNTPPPFDRQHAVTVPNVGGFAGVSFKFPNAKVSLGYRGDFFFGAMDTGMDTQKTKTVGFYGPFATISFGIGG